MRRKMKKKWEEGDDDDDDGVSNIKVFADLSLHEPLGGLLEPSWRRRTKRRGRTRVEEAEGVVVLLVVFVVVVVVVVSGTT